eukprot:scaffold12363_cov23-Cyclotella_meneghiniana.AAC.1
MVDVMFWVCVQGNTIRVQGTLRMSVAGLRMASHALNGFNASPFCFRSCIVFLQSLAVASNSS